MSVSVMCGKFVHNSKLSVFFVLFTTNLLAKCRYSNGKTLNFGTKTPYEWTSGYSPQTAQADNECGNTETVNLLRRCTPIHGHVIYRHGLRFPSTDYVQTTSYAWNKINDLIRYEELKDWKSNFKIEDDKKLAQKGILEMLGLGIRFGQGYCKMLSKFGPAGVDIVSSSKSRSFHSAESYRQGLFASLGWRDVDVTPVAVNDNMLRFFKKCGLYQKYLKTTTSGEPIYLQEYLKFLRGPEMTYVTKSISEKMKIPLNILTNEELYAIYYVGAYESIIHDDYRLLDLFSPDHFDILNYQEDLKHFWKKSFGHKLNYLMSCGLVQRVYAGMADAITLFRSNQTYKVGIFQFGHAETLFPLYAALGLHDDTLLRADEYRLNLNRSFFSSKLAPFSANIAFILYHCVSEVGQVNENDFFVKMLVNERPVTMPGCDELCPFSTWTEEIKYLLDLNFNSLCAVGRNDL